MMSITCHFSGGEEPWQLRESSVGGGIRARALAEFIVGLAPESYFDLTYPNDVITMWPHAIGGGS